MPATEEQLIELWRSNLLTKEVAQQLAMHPREVSLAWRRLKARGLLPKGDRPRNRTARYINDTSGGDGRPQDDGSMLDALHRAHMIFFPIPSAPPGFTMWGATRDDLTFIISSEEETGTIMASVKVAGSVPFDNTRIDLGKFKTVDEAICACREFKRQ
jgi:hypothetical protein